MTTPLDDQNVDQVQRSWSTRMASVLRQFKSLADEPVFDRQHRQMVNIVGLVFVGEEPVLTLQPTDIPGANYASELEHLEV